MKGHYLGVASFIIFLMLGICAPMFGMHGHEQEATWIMRGAFFFLAASPFLIWAHVDGMVVARLRTYASRPISEWPNMSLKRFKWLLNIAETNIWQEDIRDYCDRQPNRRDFLYTYFNRGYPLFAYRLDMRGNPNESVTPFKTREKAAQKEPLCY